MFKWKRWKMRVKIMQNKQINALQHVLYKTVRGSGEEKMNISNECECWAAHRNNNLFVWIKKNSKVFSIEAGGTRMWYTWRANWMECAVWWRNALDSNDCQAPIRTWSRVLITLVSRAYRVPNWYDIATVQQHTARSADTYYKRCYDYYF